MVQVEAEFEPIGTRQSIRTDEGEFANALFELALKAGCEVEPGDVVGSVYSMEVVAEDAELNGLIQAAYALAFEREATAWRRRAALKMAA